jgi:Tfp pilus assembly protein PilV
MLPNITEHRNEGRSGFTMAEFIIAAVVSMYVTLGALSVYMMVLTWWHQTAPRIEAQRTARIALSRVIDGIVDSDAGTDATASSGTYRRRNGIAWAVSQDSSTIPSIPTDAEIDFALESDSSRVRAFYLGTDAGGSKVVYYKYNSSSEEIKGTKGITDLKFEFIDVTNKNLVRVTVKVEKDVQTGTGSTTYPVRVECSETVFLRNVKTT